MKNHAQKPPCDCYTIINGMAIPECDCRNSDDMASMHLWCDEHNRKVKDPTPEQIEAAARAICLHHHRNENYNLYGESAVELNTITIGWEKFIPQAKAALIAASEVES